MSDPVDHHYLPIFYLSRWVGADGKVCRFSRPYGEKVVTKRVAPKGTAFEEYLYSARMPDGPPNLAMGKGFRARMVSEAADALALLEQGLRKSKWKPQLRSAWSRFV